MTYNRQFSTSRVSWGLQESLNLPVSLIGPVRAPLRVLRVAVNHVQQRAEALRSETSRERRHHLPRQPYFDPCVTLLKSQTRAVPSVLPETHRWPSAENTNDCVKPR